MLNFAAFFRNWYNHNVINCSDWFLRMIHESALQSQDKLHLVINIFFNAADFKWTCGLFSFSEKFRTSGNTESKILPGASIIKFRQHSYTNMNISVKCSSVNYTEKAIPGLQNKSMEWNTCTKITPAWFLIYHTRNRNLL